MNDTLKALAWSFAKSIADRGAVALGVALLSHGWLVPAQVTGFDQIAAGAVMIAIGAAVGWYRDHGKALLKAQIDALNAQVDAVTKNIQQGTVTIEHPSGSKISLDQGSVKIESNGTVSLSGTLPKN